MSDLIDWLASFFVDIWDDFVEFITDIPLIILDKILGAVASIFEAITLPQFLTDGLGPLMSAVDPGILYFIDRSGITPALALLGVGLGFRLTRKIFTLGRW